MDHLRAGQRHLFAFGLIELLLLVGLSAAGITGCNRATCIGLYPPTQDRNAPALTQVQILPQDAQSPWTLLMAMDFTDRDGDLGDGNVLIFAGASAPVSMALAPHFRASELPLGATSGRFSLPLGLAQGAVSDENVLRLGFQLVDALQHYSNCYALDLHFAVDAADSTPHLLPTAQVQPLRAQRVACAALAREPL